MKNLTVTQTETFTFRVPDDFDPATAEDWFCSQDDPIRDAARYDVELRECRVDGTDCEELEADQKRYEEISAPSMRP